MKLSEEIALEAARLGTQSLAFQFADLQWRLAIARAHIEPDAYDGATRRGLLAVEDGMRRRGVW